VPATEDHNLDATLAQPADIHRAWEEGAISFEESLLHMGVWERAEFERTASPEDKRMMQRMAMRMSGAEEEPSRQARASEPHNRLDADDSLNEVIFGREEWKQVREALPHRRGERRRI
jgi:hypothetical protein